MKINYDRNTIALIHETLELIPSDVSGTLIVPLFSGTDLTLELAAADLTSYSSAIGRQAVAQKFKAETNQVLTYFSGCESGPQFIVLVGLGEQKSLSRKSLCTALTAALKTIHSTSVAIVALALDQCKVTATEYGYALAEAAMLSQYTYHLKTVRGGHKEDEQKIETITIHHSDQALTSALKQGWTIAQAIAFARKLSDMPPNLLTPEEFMRIARICADHPQLEITILPKDMLTLIGAGGVLAVGRGSSHACYLIEIAYTPTTGATKKKLGMIGKTINFDSGGQCVKTPAGQEHMKRDMSGGGNVLATIQAMAELDIPLSVNAYFAPVFNMMGDDAYMVGEVINMLGGLTVENKNTDAEGRLTLADMVEWAQQRGCDWLIQEATLTGAAVQVVGDAAACVMGNHNAFTDLVYSGGQATGEEMQVLTMFEKIRGYNKSTVADLQNTSGSHGAGCIAAGWFCREFVRDDRPWVHLDIAPVMDSGFGIKTLIWVARRLAEEQLNKPE